MKSGDIKRIEEVYAKGGAGVGEIRSLLEGALDNLDRGALRVAEKDEARGAWRVHEWVKKALLLSFQVRETRLIEGAAEGGFFWDKMPSKCAGWKREDFERAGFRMAPGAHVRHGAYIAPRAVLMPSFVNLGAYVGEGVMVDTWSTIGSCAQIGRDVHISGGVGIGGVLEPVQGRPVIIEDGAFIGARSEIVEGVIVGEGAVLAMGVYLSASTKIVDRETGRIFQGEVPPFSVVVPGSLPAASPLPDGSPAPSLSCAVIVKRVDAQTRAKTSTNELLRS